MLSFRDRVGAVLVRMARVGSGRATLVRRVREMAAILRADGVGGVIRRYRSHRAWRTRRGVQPPTPEDRRYQLWLERHQPSAERIAEMRRHNQRWAVRPLISIVVPVFNPDHAWLDAMVSSVRTQAYDNWELCLADDCSPAPHVRPALSGWAAADRRIKVAFREQNGNIAAASNTALAMATGDFVALLDPDDVLRPHALHAVVETLQADADTDLVYSDEDKILVGGQRGQVHFKGEFDPDYLLSTNYISHLSVLRRDAVAAVGGFRAGLDGSQDHDLVLRVSERATRVRHVPDVLYSWRQVPGSAALDHAEKPAAWEAGRRAVDDALARRHPGAHAELGPLPGLYQARYPIRPGVRVTAILSAVDATTTASTLRALRQGHASLPVRWVVAGHDPGLDGLARVATVEVVVGDEPQPRLLNELVAADESDVVVFLAGDVAPARADMAWLEPLVEQALRSTVGAAGGRIMAADGSAVCDAVRMDAEHGVASVGVRLPVIQRVSAVSIECMAVERTGLMAAGGFDESYCLRLHDVDLCLRLRSAGLAIVHTPLTEMRRLRSQRGLDQATDDVDRFRTRWEGSPVWADPYVSPWLETVTPLVIRA